MKKVFDRALLLYVLIGITNFIACTAIMFFLYNYAGWSKDTAPIVNYGLGSLIWYVSCLKIVFPGHKSSVGLILKFCLEVVVCYVLAYYVFAGVLTQYAINSHSIVRLLNLSHQADPDVVRDNCYMAIGAFAYSILNYFGQRYFVFHDAYRAKKSKRSEKAAVG